MLVRNVIRMCPFLYCDLVDDPVSCDFSVPCTEPKFVCVCVFCIIGGGRFMTCPALPRTEASSWGNNSDMRLG